MASTEEDSPSGDVWFVYDGECPVCTRAARALQIRRSVGRLHLVDARKDENHPLVREVTGLRLDLDEGMVLKFQGVCYHGEDALHMMALLGSSKGWFNQATAFLFRSRLLARLCYPPMRAIRNLLLRLNGVDKIGNLHHRQPPGPVIFQSVFGADWDFLPKVMRDHYAVRACSDDLVVVEGTLDISVSPLVALLSRLSGMLVSRSGESVPVTVTFSSGPDSAAFHFDRVFHYPDGDKHFRSRMESVGDGDVVEFMRFGIGWKTAYDWDGKKITLSHRGYVWRVFGAMIPIPMTLLFGQGHAEETPLSETEFSMWTHTKHPLFGVGFAYSGRFKVTQVSCPATS